MTSSRLDESTSWRLEALNEASLVDALRKAADPYISLVAIESGQVVGHIFFSPVSFKSRDVDPEGPNAHASRSRGELMMGLAPMACCQSARTKVLVRCWFEKD